MFSLSSKNRFMSLTGALVVSALYVGLASPAQAQRNNDAPAPVEGRQFSSKSGEVVNQALGFMNSDQYSAAVGVLNQALAMDLNPYERSTTYQMMGQAKYQLNDLPGATSAFENAISSGGLLPNEATTLRVSIAQLMIASGRNAEGAQMLENYLNQGNPSKPEYIDMLVGAWVQAEDYRRALPWAEKWFNVASPKERKHFDLLNFLYNNLGMTGKQADIVMQMLVRFPEDKTLWDTWASMLANGGREDDAFEVNKMLYLGGALSSESDIMKIVQYFSYYEMPFQAAKILEREMNAGKVSKSTDHLIQLSDLLRQAREFKRAIPILEQASANAGTGKVYAQLGEALYNDAQCDRAEDAFKKGINLGYGRGKAWMLIATCRYEASQSQGRIDCDWSDEKKAAAPRTLARAKAVEAFQQVPSGSREGRDASKWMTFIAAEAQAVENRCIFEKNVRRDVCYGDIEQAYKATIFNGGDFNLSDPSCQDFVPAYDKIYRIKIEG